MLCSAPIGNPGGSNWLDRLRSTKGFPVGGGGGGDDDLDHFLSRNPNSASPNSPPPPIPTQPRLREPPEWNNTTAAAAAAAVRNVLSELFFIGGSAENSEVSGKKLPRKQANPRLCAGSAANNGGGNGNSNSTELADQIRTRKKIKKKKKTNKIMKKIKNKNKKKHKRSDFAAKSPATVSSDSNSLTQSTKRIEMEVDLSSEEEEEEEEGEKELRGYSRSEVTVIDTSFSDWKSEKLVYRKKNVWKVREKRGKSKSFLGRKKRKNGGDNHHHDHDGEQVMDLNCVGKVEMKRAKVLGQYDNGDQSLKRSLLDEEYGQNIKNNSREEEEEDCRPATNRKLGPSLGNHGQDFKKMPRLPGSPSKLKRNGSSSSSVLLVKAIPTDRKLNGKLSNSPKPYQKQQHKTYP